MSSQTVDLEAAASDDLDADVGVPGGAAIRAFVAALLGDDAKLPQARDGLVAALGREAALRACTVAAFFDAINRVADATGTELDGAGRAAR